MIFAASEFVGIDSGRGSFSLDLARPTEMTLNKWEGGSDGGTGWTKKT